MIRPIILAIAAISLPICGAQAGRYNRGNESVHQPVVQRTDYVLDVAGNGLDPAEASQVRQWLNAIGLGYGDRVSVDISAGGDGSTQDIAAIIASYGLFVSEGAPVTEGTIPTGSARIVVSRSTATVSGCPDYSQWSHPNFTGATTSNFGCAINSTLAAMVANPEDLVKGQTTQGSSPDTATKAIRVWRNADPTAKNGLKIETTNKGEN